MATDKSQKISQPTGRVVHDARGNSVWRINESAYEEFRDTQTWVVRALEVPGLSIDDGTVDPRYSSVDTDPYNRRR